MIKNTILAIDYGRKHCGVALVKDGWAEPMATVVTEDIFDWLSKHKEELLIEALVIGVSEQQMAKESWDFGVKVNQQFNLPIYAQDETLSSYETRKKMAQAGLKQSRLRKKMDHLVAATLGQDFVDNYDTLDQVPNDARIA